MALLSSQTVPETGSNEAGLTFDAAANGGDTFTNTQNEVLWIKNANASARTVTVGAASQCNHGFSHDISVNVPATDSVIVPMLQLQRFGQTVSLTYSTEVDLTIAVLRVN